MVDTVYLGCTELIRAGSSPVIPNLQNSGYRLIGRSGAFQALGMGSSPIIRNLFSMVEYRLPLWAHHPENVVRVHAVPHYVCSSMEEQWSQEPQVVGSSPIKPFIAWWNWYTQST